MSTTRPRTDVVLVAWAVLIAASLLPVVIAKEVLGQDLSRDARAEGAAIVIAAGLALTLAWTPLRVLRPFLALLLVLVGAQWFATTQLDRLPVFATPLHDPSFGVYMPAEVLMNLVVTLAVIVALVVVKRDRRAFYLARGDTSAPAEPIGWLGVKPGARWNTLGRDLSVFITLGTLAFLVLSGTPSLDLVARALPFRPPSFSPRRSTPSTRR